MIRALLIALALPTAAHAQQVDSVYSTHDWSRDCHAVETDAPPDEAGMGWRLICPGPGEMHVMLSEGDMRMSMDYGRAPRFGPWESFTGTLGPEQTVAEFGAAVSPLTGSNLTTRCSNSPMAAILASAGCGAISMGQKC